MDNTIDAREILRRLRWLERAESLLHELTHPEIADPDIDAVASVLAEEVALERQKLRVPDWGERKARPVPVTHRS